MTGNATSLALILTGMLCASAAFGVLLTTMLVRGNLRLLEGQGAVSDMIYTDKTYSLTSILASIGAVVSLRHNIGVAVSFLGVAIAFQIAEHWLLPQMRMAAQSGQSLPLLPTRARFEFFQAVCLLLVFANLAMPPLITLVRVHGL